VDDEIPQTGDGGEVVQEVGVFVSEDGSSAEGRFVTVQPE
jgi:hypothetical protein